jgi:hypothetical protein
MDQTRRIEWSFMFSSLLGWIPLRQTFLFMQSRTPPLRRDLDMISSLSCQMEMQCLSTNQNFAQCSPGARVRVRVLGDLVFHADAQEDNREDGRLNRRRARDINIEGYIHEFGGDEIGDDEEEEGK